MDDVEDFWLRSSGDSRTKVETNLVFTALLCQFNGLVHLQVPSVFSNLIFCVGQFFVSVLTFRNLGSMAGAPDSEGSRLGISQWVLSH